VTIDASVRLAPGAVVRADVSLLGETSVGPGCELHAGSWLRDARLGSDVEVLPYSVLDGASVSDGCRVGPFARLRPGTELGQGARIGNFVEVKNATLGPGAKANHLAYVGDAEVGPGTNIGAGVVTCNYDGVRKHRTTIGKDAFVGTDTILVAPVEVGDGAFIAAGSVIVRDVPGDALGIARSRQRNIADWVSSRGPRARRDDESS
jgi:bifunctional UDP-N-acetylglucosamine pyrophosphorylase/glucosamine-1-phosphate N-acetyltransferase